MQLSCFSLFVFLCFCFFCSLMRPIILSLLRKLHSFWHGTQASQALHECIFTVDERIAKGERQAQAEQVELPRRRTHKATPKKPQCHILGVDTVES